MDILNTAWVGAFKYDHVSIEPMRTTVHFEQTGDRKFAGSLTEPPLVLPATLTDMYDIKSQKLRTIWGSVKGDIMMGEWYDIGNYGWGLALQFVRCDEQLSGFPILCCGGYNKATNRITGHWSVFAGDEPCDLPVTMKRGSFVLSKGGIPSVAKETVPINPNLVLA